MKPDLEERWKVFREQQAKNPKSEGSGGGGITASEGGAKKPVPVPAREQVEEELKKEEMIIPPKKQEEAPKKVAAAPVLPEKKSESVAEMEKISTYNGAATDKYNWSQTVQDVQVQIPIPEGTKANQLDIKI